ncbi:hypothetical protein C8R46DRAFT_1032221 [Mycena filopes]|nr:hypothetical protein C8R46DRAFT_1032221 [Mycena filopes]
MGRMIDQSYALKVMQGDHQLTATNHFQREAYRKSQVNSLKVRLWVQNDKPGIGLAVSVPHFPWFHPKDCEPILLLAAPDTCVSYSYWDTKEWILTNTALEIKGGTEILFLRLSHITDCLDGPRCLKRRVSDASNTTPSPFRFRMSTGRTQPRISPLSYNSSQKPNSVISISSSEEGDLDGGEEPEIPEMTSALSGDPPPTSSALTFTPTVSPPTPSASHTPKFPLDFACEMDTAFKAMSQHTGNIPERFAKAFGLQWHSSTYYTHYAVWSGMDRDALSYAVQCGHNSGGYWHSLVKFVKQRTNAVKLRFEHLKHILRIHREVTKLTPSPPSYAEAAKALATEQIPVNWTYVLHGLGPATGVDIKIRELYNKGIVQLPSELEKDNISRPSSPLTPNPSSSPESPGKEVRMPTPTPLKSADGCRATREELKNSDLVWEILSYNPEVDFKLFDPKIVVAEMLDAENCLLKRFNILDITAATTYQGRFKKSHPVDEAHVTLNDMDQTFMVAVHVRTKQLIQNVILNNMEFHEADVAYEVYWAWPTLNTTFNVTGQVMKPLCTYNPAQTPSVQWNIDSDHDLLAMGDSKALRILLLMEPVKEDVQEEEEVLESERLNNRVAQYLLKTHGYQKVLQEIRDINRDPKEKGKGRTPKVWASWIDTMTVISDCEVRVPASADEDIARKAINKTHLAKLVLASSDWTSKCLQAQKIVKGRNGRATNEEMDKYLKKEDGPPVGIEKFLAKLVLLAK